MYKRSGIFVGILTLGFFGFLLNTPLVSAAEQIDNFQTRIEVVEGGSLIVQETITYTFEEKRHGIFRDIPLESPDGPKLALEVLGVQDENKISYPYTTSAKSGIFRIKIGDPDEFVTGTKTYVIEYRVGNAIREFSNYNEIYWNITGNQWAVPILQSAASIIFPKPLSEVSRTACFTGETGQSGEDCSLTITSSVVALAVNRSLNPQEGVTVAIGFPSDLINIIPVPPTESDKGESPLLLIFPGVFVFLAFAFVIQAWWRKGKPSLPPELRDKPIVVQYELSKDLTAVDSGAIYDGRLDDVDLGAVIIDLAVQKYLKIKYLEDNDYEFIKLKDGSDLQHPAYRMLFNFLFVASESVTLSGLQEKEARLDQIRLGAEMEEYLKNGGYLKEKEDNLQKRKRNKRFLGISAVVFLVTLLIFIGSGILDIASLRIGPGLFVVFITLVITFIFSMLWYFLLFGRPKYGLLSFRGIETLAAILGFRDFLKLTEQDRLRLLNAPELKPDLFEKYLPYAMSLHVEKEWAKKFEGIYTNQPAWFEGPSGTFHATAFASQMSGLSQSFNATVGTYSSGSSGAGSSGGGSGGGGGGSW